MLLEIANENIDWLFKLLMIPVYHQSVIQVVVHILTSVQHTPVIFNRLIPKIIHFYGSNKYDKMDVSQLTDTIAALMIIYPGNAKYLEIVNEIVYFCGNMF